MKLNGSPELIQVPDYYHFGKNYEERRYDAFRNYDGKTAVVFEGLKQNDINAIEYYDKKSIADFSVDSDRRLNTSDFNEYNMVTIHDDNLYRYHVFENANRPFFERYKLVNKPAYIGSLCASVIYILILAIIMTVTKSIHAIPSVMLCVVIVSMVVIPLLLALGESLPDYSKGSPNRAVCIALPVMIAGLLLCL